MTESYEVKVKEDTKFRQILNLSLNIVILLVVLAFDVSFYRLYKNFINFIRSQPS